MSEYFGPLADIWLFRYLGRQHLNSPRPLLYSCPVQFSYKF